MALSAATKRRLSIGGSALPVEKERMEEDDQQATGASVASAQRQLASRVDNLELQMAATIQKADWTYDTVKNMQKQSVQPLITVTPWTAEYIEVFWKHVDKLLSPPSLEEMVGRIDISEINDTQRNRLTFKVAQTSKLQQIVQQIRGICEEKELALRVQPTQSNAEKQITYLPRVLFKLLDSYLREYGLFAEEVVHSVLPNTIDAPGFEHAIEIGGKPYIVANARLIEMEKVKVLQISMCDTIKVESEQWDLGSIAQEYSRKVDEFTGFPYLCNFEIVSQDTLAPTPRKVLPNGKAITIAKESEDSASASTDGKAGKKGKGKGKGKGGGKTGKDKGKGGKGKGKRAKEGMEW
mmetsp:Transcript_45239/g.80234  ORF Transcript_45239/g.80234 Transcript_45239/m.80234 type:complete len:352 (-) Transcript_45239:48-1103(-)